MLRVGDQSLELGSSHVDEIFRIAGLEVEIAVLGQAVVDHRGDSVGRADGRYDSLRAVSTEGDWYRWFRLFLNAIATQAIDAQQRADRLLDLQKQYHDNVRAPRASALLPKLVDHLFHRPVLNVKEVVKVAWVTSRAAGNLIAKLERAGILREVTGRSYRRVWLAEDIISVIQDPDEAKE